MKNQKSLTNKGFSLVELIIVVAIMAILIGVLAPQYLRYVEKSRLQKDNTSIAEIADVIKMMSAEESLIDKFPSDGSPVEFAFGTDNVFKGAATPNYDALNTELKNTVGDFDDIKLSSNTYDGSELKIKASVDPTSKVMKVTCEEWIETVGGSAAGATSPKTF